MKAHSLTLYSVAALLAFNFFSTKEAVKSPVSRVPASVSTNTNATAISIVNVNVKMPEQKAQNVKELKRLKTKLVNLEKELRTKKENDQQNSEDLQKEIADIKASIKASHEEAKQLSREAQIKSEEKEKIKASEMAKLEAELAAKKENDAKIESLQQEIASLKTTISDSKIAANDELQNSLCLSKRHEAELEDQIKKQLQDKEDILKQFESLKSEVRLSKETKPAEPQVQVQSQAPNLDIVALMAQITSMFQTQQQQQFELQTQMINMFSQMNYNLTPPSMMSNSLSNGFGGYGIGLGMGYGQLMQNPYSQVPMERAQIPFSSGFNFGAAPAAPVFGGGFDFNSSPSMAPDLNGRSFALSQSI